MKLAVLPARCGCRLYMPINANFANRPRLQMHLDARIATRTSPGPRVSRVEVHLLTAHEVIQDSSTYTYCN